MTLPRFAYTRLFVVELREEPKGLIQIITSNREDELGLKTDGIARNNHGLAWFDRDPKNKGVLPEPFEGIVLAKDPSQSTRVTYRRRGQLGGHRISFPHYTTDSTGMVGPEWVYFIDNDRTVFTVFTDDTGGSIQRYVGPRYVPIPKEIKMATFTETFGTVKNCYRGQLIREGKISVQQFTRILRANDIDRSVSKTEQCEALERLGEFIWA